MASQYNNDEVIDGAARENAFYSDLCLHTGKPLQLHLQACDVKSKEEKSGPENMLTESSTGDGKQQRPFLRQLQ